MKKVIVIGAGPAGISAAIQLKRFGIEPLVIEKNEFGGLLKNANLVENYLGFPDGISGVDFVSLIKKQFNQYNIPLKNEAVISVEFNDKFIVKTDKITYESEYLIMATGTEPILLNFNVEADAKNKIFYEVHSLQNIKNKEIAIIGAGDAAFDYAVNLSKSNKVRILNRSDRVKALPLLVDRCKNNVNITYSDNIIVKDVEYSNEKLKLTTDKEDISVDYLLVAIGRVQNDTLLKKELKNNPNLFMIGDVKNGILRQTAIAVGDGLKAAQQIDLNELKLRTGIYENSR